MNRAKFSAMVEQSSQKVRDALLGWDVAETKQDYSSTRLAITEDEVSEVLVVGQLWEQPTHPQASATTLLQPNWVTTRVSPAPLNPRSGAGTLPVAGSLPEEHRTGGHPVTARR